MKQTAPNNKKKGRVPTPFLSECQTIAALVLESGCKSSGFGNTVFSDMNDLGSLFQPNPLFISSNIRSLPPRLL